MTTNPFKIQDFGDRIKPKGEEFDEWIDYATELLHSSIYAKFTQNPSLKGDLLSTGNCMLYEATMDYYFACGANLTSKKWEDQSWEGDNLTGRALVEVRDRIRMESTDETHQPDDDVSYATSTDCHSSGSGQEPDYKIYRRRARTTPHSSALCQAMVRKVRPTRRPRTRPHGENQNLTARSNIRRSNFNVSSTSQDQDQSLSPSTRGEHEGTVAGVEETQTTPMGNSSASPL